MKLYKGKIYEIIRDGGVQYTSGSQPQSLEFPILARFYTVGSQEYAQFEYVKISVPWDLFTANIYHVIRIETIKADGTVSSNFGASFRFMVPYDIEIDDNDIAITSGAIKINDVSTSNFMMIFIQSKAEINRVDKQPYLSDGEIQTGVLRESSSIINPQITFQYSMVPSFNYVYIPSFNRFYFVNGFTFISKNLWVMNLSVDVLMSYNYEIRQQTAYINRQENIYDDELVDDEIDTHYAKSISNKVISPTTQIFPVTQSEEDTRNSYLLTVVKQ